MSFGWYKKLNVLLYAPIEKQGTVLPFIELTAKVCSIKQTQTLFISILLLIYSGLRTNDRKVTKLSHLISCTKRSEKCTTHARNVLGTVSCRG